MEGIRRCSNTHGKKLNASSATHLLCLREEQMFLYIYELRTMKEQEKFFVRFYLLQNLLLSI